MAIVEEGSISAAARRLGLTSGAVALRIRAFEGELDLLDGIVAAGLGVAVVPDWSGPRRAGAAVATITLPPPVPSRRIGLFHRSRSAARAAIGFPVRAMTMANPARGGAVPPVPARSGVDWAVAGSAVSACAARQDGR